ncbi:uncharacterized protein [Chelonus insularis]|uniref:uncharacterized protein n=1 Tax=Chelonus insularis TaxID=460826 RepID=UPI00158BEB43|nr:uncharacterized protein LOC118066353 [Chelonus insularis]
MIARTLLLIAIGVQVIGIQSLTNSVNETGIFEPRKNQTPLHKVELTQRGYIQFLRWMIPVPEINEFTFCVWVKSMNLTYPHSIFSYSKNETERLVRAWIAPQGRSIHLEINSTNIFNHPTFIQEHQWYHICQSWHGASGRYGLWIDGQIILDGYAPEMAGHVIPKDGDLVLGQEYTDFDKGLEEGIEGAVFGFNLLLLSAFAPSSLSFERNQLGDDAPAGIHFPVEDSSEVTNIGPAIFPPVHSRYAREPVIPEFHTSQSHIVRIRKPKQVSIIPTQIRGKNLSWLKPTSVAPLGLQLIETGYYHCKVGRGSPFLGGSKLLISWTRTPVGVFGGAILKNVDSRCGVFNPL